LNGSPEEQGKIEKGGDLEGELIRPKGSIGPITFVILMHGCSGYTKLVRKWANEKAKIFLAEGYGVLNLDSFKTRKVKETCGSANYHWGWRRAEDAYSALQYLIDKNLAKPDSVYAMGRSNGGTAMIMAATGIMTDNHPHRFAALFAVSPGCEGMAKARIATPLVMFVGGKDDANDPSACVQLKDAPGLPAQIVLFKGVHHGFEDNTPSYIDHGWHMEHKPKADNETIAMTLGLIKSNDFHFQRGVQNR
jgi:dienelactone hydrolase